MYSLIYAPFCLFCCVVIEVALDKYDRCTLIAGAGCKVAERTDEVCELTGCCTLRRHVTYKVAVLLNDLFLDSCLELFTGKTCKFVVCKILELELIGSSLKSCCICRRNYRAASSQIFPTGSLKAPSPYTITSTHLPVALRILC